jgi:hypothetical protein
MPFDWNMTRLEEQKQLLVNQEVSIPKGSALASNSYVGTINNKQYRCNKKSNGGS